MSYGIWETIEPVVIKTTITRNDFYAGLAMLGLLIHAEGGSPVGIEQQIARQAHKIADEMEK